MATRRQKKANRKNANRSTGPRTPEGKARSSQNACQHGLFARDTVLPDENPREFLDLIGDLEQELNAVGGFERRLVRHIADAEWRMRRIVRLETGVLTHQLESERLRVQRIRADFGGLPPSLQSKPGEQTQPPHDPGVQNRSGGPIEQNTLPAGAYQQTTRELGSAIESFRDSPVLLTLSLYESRLNRKHQSLLKQLRLTQKLRLAEGPGRNEIAGPQCEGAVPGHETAEPRNESPQPGPESEAPQPLPVEAQHHPAGIESEARQPQVKTPTPDAGEVEQPPETREDSSARGTPLGPRDEIASVA